MIEEYLKIHGDYRNDKSFKELTTIKMGGEIAHYIEPYNQRLQARREARRFQA